MDNKLPSYQQSGWGATLNNYLAQLNAKIGTLEKKVNNFNQDTSITKFSGTGLTSTGTAVTHGGITFDTPTIPWDADSSINVSGGGVYFSADLTSDSKSAYNTIPQLSYSSTTTNNNSNLNCSSMLAVVNNINENLSLERYNINDGSATGSTAWFNVEKSAIGVFTHLGNDTYFTLCPFLCTHSAGERFHMMNLPGVSFSKLQNNGCFEKATIYWEGINYLNANSTSTYLGVLDDFNTYTYDYSSSSSYPLLYLVNDVDSNGYPQFASTTPYSLASGSTWQTYINNSNNFVSKTNNTISTVYVYRYFITITGRIICAKEAITLSSNDDAPYLPSSSTELMNYIFDSNSIGNAILKYYKWSAPIEYLRSTVSIKSDRSGILNTIYCKFNTIADSNYVQRIETVSDGMDLVSDNKFGIYHLNDSGKHFKFNTKFGNNSTPILTLNFGDTTSTTNSDNNPHIAMYNSPIYEIERFGAVYDNSNPGGAFDIVPKASDTTYRSVTYNTDKPMVQFNNAIGSDILIKSSNNSCSVSSRSISLYNPQIFFSLDSSLTYYNNLSYIYESAPRTYEKFLSEAGSTSIDFECSKNITSCTVHYTIQTSSDANNINGSVDLSIYDIHQKLVNNQEYEYEKTIGMNQKITLKISYNSTNSKITIQHSKTNLYQCSTTWNITTGSNLQIGTNSDKIQAYSIFSQAFTINSTNCTINSDSVVVNSKTKFNDNLQIDGDISISGTQTFTSDARYKTIDSPLTNGISAINSLPLYNYHFSSTSKQSIGLMAQDLQRVLPQLVHETDDSANGGYSNKLSIEEGKLVYVCMRAIQELSAEIDDLKKQLRGE